MGFTMDFTVVTKWLKDKEKVCETIGKAKMIIMDWYQMRLVIFRDALNSLCDKYNFPKKRLLIEQEVERI